MSENADSTAVDAAPSAASAALADASPDPSKSVSGSGEPPPGLQPQQPPMPPYAGNAVDPHPASLETMGSRLMAYLHRQSISEVERYSLKMIRAELQAAIDFIDRRLSG